MLGFAAPILYNVVAIKYKWFGEMERNKLFWASRRGMLELDLVLMPFLEKVYPTLDEVNQQRYQQLLEQEDQDLFIWFMRRQDPQDPELLAIVDIIRANTGMQPDELT